MCGIAGIVSLDGSPLAGVESSLARMMNLLQHRGPDQEGYWVSQDQRVALVNTRLSIVGVDDAPKLPLQDADRRGVLAFNGEIYNHQELRSDLKSRGCRFRTRTDTEVLLNGLLTDGSAFLDKADGFWGFAFYDESKRSLLVARDLMGEKPVYFAEVGSRLYFASEIPPLLAVLPRDAISLSVHSIVSGFQYRSAKPGETLIRNIKRLTAGCALEIDVHTGSLSRKRLQRLQPEKWFEFYASDPSEQAVIEKFADRISASCERRLPAEVDFFATLSGGLDSTLVNYYLSGGGARKINSLYGVSTIVSPQRGSDLGELEASRYTSERIKSNWSSFSMISEDAVDLYEEAAAASFDGIFCEGVANFQQLASETNKGGKKVLVLSDGPDELLGGYDVDLRAFQLSERLTSFSATAKAALHDRAADENHMRGKSSALLNWAYLAGTPFTVRPNHCGTRPEVMSQLFTPEFSALAYKAFGQIDPCYEPILPSMDVSQKMALAYACTSLPDYVNTRSDRGTMKESIEARMPFQSVQLAELFIAAPARWRFHGGKWSKYLLRRLISATVGDTIAYRSKYGFAQPLWKIEGMAKKLRMREVIMDSPVFNQAPFGANVKQLLTGPGEKRLGWMAYCLARTHDRLRLNYSL